MLILLTTPILTQTTSISVCKLKFPRQEPIMCIDWLGTYPFISVVSSFKAFSDRGSWVTYRMYHSIAEW